MARPTTDLRSDAEELIAWLAMGVPLAALLALIGGYVLSARALAPVRALARAVDGIEGHELAARLPTHAPPDEIDALAERFNSLLDRVVAAREQARRFLAESAHQIRTPLTIVRGESALALERERDGAEYQAALRRIHRASQQMAHRVNDLFLLARAEAGERPAVDQVVELDGLVLDVTDLMRSRVAEARHRVDLERVEAVETSGNDALLGEALTELVENALRYADRGEPIGVSARIDDGRAVLEVSSRGVDVARAASERSVTPGGETRGLGLSIVRWIAEVHGGTLEVLRTGARNVYRVSWPHRLPGRP